MRNPICLAAFVALAGPLAATSPALPPAQWSTRGPGGGGAMYSPTINPANPDEMYVASDMSPEFHSTDGGRTWETVDFRKLQSNRECAVRFTKDPDVRWALDFSPANGGDAARPARSADGGKTWTRLPAAAWPQDRVAYVLYNDYDNPGRAVVSADYRDLYVTLDGGKSFDRKLRAANANAGLHLAGAFFDGDTVYVGLNDGLYLSKDGGKSFAKCAVTGLPAASFIVSFAGGKSHGKTRLVCVTLKQGWAGITGAEHGSYSGLYVMEAGQPAWTRKGKDIPPAVHPFFVRMALNDADTAYVAGGGPGGAPTVFKTCDGGETWSDAFRTQGNQNIIPGWAGTGCDFNWSFPEYALGFDVSPLDKDRLLLTDLGCAHASNDGGATWRQVYSALTAPRAPGTQVKGAAYASNGMEPTSVWQVAWADAGHIFACATDIKGFRSSDGGRTWSFDYAGHDLNTMYWAVNATKRNALFAATSSVHDLYESTHLADTRIDVGRGAVIFSADQGASWRRAGGLNKPVIWLAPDPKSPNRMYASVVNSKDGGLYVCANLDKAPACAWMPLPQPPRATGHPYNIRLLDDGAIVCTFSGRRGPRGEFTPSSGVFLSRDGGHTWEDRSSPAMTLWTKDLVVDPGDKAQNTWYVCVFQSWGRGAAGHKGGLFRTNDRGRNWALIADSSIAPSGLLNVESCAFDPADPNEFYFTTESDGLFFTPDINAFQPLFTQVESYPFRHPMRIFFNPYRPSEMWVTSFGNGIRVGEIGK